LFYLLIGGCIPHTAANDDFDEGDDVVIETAGIQEGSGEIGVFNNEGDDVAIETAGIQEGSGESGVFNNEYQGVPVIEENVEKSNFHDTHQIQKHSKGKNSLKHKNIQKNKKREEDQKIQDEKDEKKKKLFYIAVFSILLGLLVLLIVIVIVYFKIMKKPNITQAVTIIASDDSNMYNEPISSEPTVCFNTEKSESWSNIELKA
jgi:hypothetical protein